MDLTTDVKKQHTVPRFLLDHFGFGKKGKKRKLYTFDKQSEKIFQQSVYDATTRNGFYNIEGHPDQVSLESILGIYETTAAPIIKKIITERSLSWVSDEDRYKLSAFIAVQRARSYAEFSKINHMVNLFAERLPIFEGGEDIVEDDLGGDKSVERKNFFLSMVLKQEETIAHLMNKDWILYETTPKDPFYISDNPITLHNDIDMGWRGNRGIALKGIQIHLPLSSTFTLVLTCPSIKNSALEGKKLIEMYAARTPHLLETLDDPAGILELANAYEKGIPLAQNSQNVIFLNSLQVEFAEQYVFCEKEKFSLIKEMMVRDKRYRSGPRMVMQ